MNEHSPTVLVVDDDVSLLRAVRRLLKSHGYRVVTFETAEEFLRSGMLEEYFCLVLDIRLRGTLGLDLYESLVSSGVKVAVVFMTACHSPQYQKRAEDLGAVAYLRKPFGEEALLGAIESALLGRREQGQAP